MIIVICESFIAQPLSEMIVLPLEVNLWLVPFARTRQRQNVVPFQFVVHPPWINLHAVLRVLLAGDSTHVLRASENYTLLPQFC